MSKCHGPLWRSYFLQGTNLISSANLFIITYIFQLTSVTDCSTICPLEPFKVLRVFSKFFWPFKVRACYLETWLGFKHRVFNTGMHRYSHFYCKSVQQSWDSNKTLPLTFAVLTLEATLGSCVQGSWGKLPREWLKILDLGGEPECTLFGKQCTLWVMCCWHTAVWRKRTVPPKTDATPWWLNSALGNTCWSCQFPRLWLSPDWLGPQLPGLVQVKDTAFLEGIKKEEKRKAEYTAVFQTPNRCLKAWSLENRYSQCSWATW